MLSFKKEKLPFREIEINLISPNPNQPRKHFSKDELENLANSIRQYGIINPLTVREKDGKYELISGERRLKSAALIGLASVPCHIIMSDEQKSAEIALVENIVREDLNFFEEAQALLKLSEDFSMTQKEIADKIGKTQSAVANKIRLLKLFPSTVEQILTYGLTERHARALLKLEDETIQSTAAKYIGENQLNVIKSEAHIDMILRKTSKKERNTPKIMIRDIRLFVNSLNNLMDNLLQSGIDAGIEKEEDDSFLSYTVKIPKITTSSVAKR